jgi:hypothetical protein
VDRMWEMECNMKIRNEKMGFWLITFSKNYFDACFPAQIVTLDQTRHLRPFSGSVRKNLFLFLILWSRVAFIKYDEYKIYIFFGNFLTNLPRILRRIQNQSQIKHGVNTWKLGFLLCDFLYGFGTGIVAVTSLLRLGSKIMAPVYSLF